MVQGYPRRRRLRRTQAAGVNPCSGGSGCQPGCRQGSVVGLLGGAAAVGAVRTAGVVEVDVGGQAAAHGADRLVGFGVDVLVLDALPQPLDEHVVAPAAAPVHADGDAVAVQRVGELQAGELAALVGVHDLGSAVARNGLLQGSDAEVRLHGDRHAMGQHATAVPVQDGGQVDEAARHRDVRDVHRPDLVGAVDLQT